MACTRVLQQQGQPQHSRQWEPAGPKGGAPSSGSASSGRDVGPCGYRVLTGPGAGTTCWNPDHSASSCYRRLDDLHRERFGPHAITPHWPSRLRQRTTALVESHLPGLVETVGNCAAGAVLPQNCTELCSASEGLCVGAAATTSLPAFVAGSGATSQTAQLSFTLDSGASSCFFRDCTDLTPLRSPVTVALADPSVGPVVARTTTTLPCPAAPSRFLTGYYTPSFSRNLVGVSHLHGLGVVTTFPVDEPVASCTAGTTGAPLVTFHRESGSGLYSLHTRSHHTWSGQVRSGQVAAVSCDCRSLTHPSVLWHHRLGHPSFPHLSRMARYRLVSGLPESLAPLPRSPAPLCTPCLEGRQRAAPHSSSFPPTTAPFQTLHLDVWGPSPVLGPRQERYFLIVVDDYSRYTTVFPLRWKADVPTVLEPWRLAWGGAQGLCGLRLHSDRGVFKARYVARGFSQREGVDFFQAFAPTPKMSTLRVLLHIAAQRDYELHSLDFSTAFLQGSLHEQIWLRRPPGFTESFPPGTQWQLHQAPREWHDTLRSTLAALDFFPSFADPSLFVRRGSTPFFVLVYVDDLVFATPDRRALASVKEELQRRHTCTDLGELQHYLGLQITRDRAARTITLTQSHMVEQILTRFRFPFSKSFESSGPYPELVGCLMYLMTCTRPDLAYPLSVLARFVAPGRHRPSHWSAAKRVAKYVASTSGMGLVLGGKQPVTLTGYSDSSWADDAETRRSTQGYSFSLGTGAASWRSARASSVTSSSCEAEVYPAALAAQELRWLSFLLTDLGERPRSPPVLFADNRSAVLSCVEPRLVGKAKHIQLRYFLLRELQQRGQALVRRVVSEANTADIFTKALPPCDHQRFCTQLGLVPARPHLLT
ncbi:unnamed protein product [Closterium sp. NIES-53]